MEEIEEEDRLNHCTIFRRLQMVIPTAKLNSPKESVLE
jgi:hypothetical protein